MTRARENLEAAGGHSFVGPMGMAHRDQRILLTPNDERRYARGEVKLVGGADALASRIDDGPDSMEECAARIGLLERTEASPGLGQVGALAKT